MYPLYKMKQNATDGTEYLSCIDNENKRSALRDELRKANTMIGHTKCEYCGCEVLGV